jgi:signal transduction histidine kinase
MTKRTNSPKPKRRHGAVGGPSPRLAVDAGTRSGAAKEQRILSAEAAETLNAIRAGQIDALVIHGDDSDKLYAVRSFVDIERTQVELQNIGAARERSEAQLKAIEEERERLFQDMHDGCIQSIYASVLNLETSLRVIDKKPDEARQLIGDATVSLDLVVQELRSFITGHRLQIAADKSLRAEIEKATETARNHGLAFTVDIDESVTGALTSEQALHLLQIAREGISNATRHAKARTGRISLQQREGAIIFELSDDGRGFVAASVNKLGLGLHHIEARARKLGGTARVSSSPGQGTRITVQMGKVAAKVAEKARGKRSVSRSKDEAKNKTNAR